MWGLRAAVCTWCCSTRPHASLGGPTTSPWHSAVMLLPGVVCVRDTSPVFQLSLVCQHHAPSGGSFASGSRGCRAWQGQSHIHPHSQPCHQPAQAASPRRGPLHAQRLRGCAHTRADPQHANCWEGKGKKNPNQPHRLSRERWRGEEREREGE